MISVAEVADIEAIVASGGNGTAVACQLSVAGRQPHAAGGRSDGAAAGEVAEKANLGLPIQPSFDQVGDLGDHERAGDSLGGIRASPRGEW